MADAGSSPITLNATITELNFLFNVTLERPDLMTKMQSVRVPRRLAVVLSREEVFRLLGAVKHIKHQTALWVAYGTGLRVGEVVALKVGDIDSERITLRVEQGKGSKDRYAMRSPLLLERLRVWWCMARAQDKMLNGGWLFPGLNPVKPLSTCQLNRAIHDAGAVTKIDKRVSMHILDHSFATYLLEQKMDIRVIQVMLWHKELDNAARYAQLATEVLRRFLLHVLPAGFHRIRHSGLIANDARKEKIALVWQLLNMVPAARTSEVMYKERHEHALDRIATQATDKFIGYVSGDGLVCCRFGRHLHLSAHCRR
jgi:integrase/recombinase XerD